MKAFEKWWESKEGTIDEESCPQCCNYHTFKHAWRAALGWAKTCTGKHYGPLDEGVVHIRIDLIEKELEEK